MKLKCTKCNKKMDVGEKTTAGLYEDCTFKNYTKWLKEELKKQNE